jgi:hypothetical protein
MEKEGEAITMPSNGLTFEACMVWMLPVSEASVMMMIVLFLFVAVCYIMFGGRADKR